MTATNVKRKDDFVDAEEIISMQSEQETESDEIESKAEEKVIELKEKKKSTKKVVQLNDVSQLKVSQHAKERYAERMANKEETLELNLYMQRHDDKITSDIKKMVQYGKLIYTGKTNGGNKLNNGQRLNLFINGAWVILVGTTDNVIITLYKKDLGLEEEFSREYVEKLADKLEERQKELAEVQKAVMEENKVYTAKIKENTSKINEYKARIKELEESNRGYDSIARGNLVQVKEAEDRVMEIVDRFTTITK